MIVYGSIPFGKLRAKFPKGCNVVRLKNGSHAILSLYKGYRPIGYKGKVVNCAGVATVIRLWRNKKLVTYHG